MDDIIAQYEEEDDEEELVIVDNDAGGDWINFLYRISILSMISNMYDHCDMISYNR